MEHLKRGGVLHACWTCDRAFLFSLNRINVAASRAQATAMVFASPALIETPCRTGEEVALVNTLCVPRE